MKEKIGEYINWELLDELKNVILLLLTTIDLIFIILSTLYSFSFRVENVFADYDYIVCLLLFIDLSYEYYSSDKTLKEFFIKDKNIITLISLLPFNLLFRYFTVFRLFKFLKLIMMIRIWHVIKDLKSLNYFIHNHLFKLLLLIFMIYIAISAGLLILLDSSVTTVGDAFWFIIVTASTVGYGDITPTTPIGKSLALLTILIGTIAIAILTAYLTSIYNQKSERETREKIHEIAELIEENNEMLHKHIDVINNRLITLEKENQELLELIKNNMEKK